MNKENIKDTRAAFLRRLSLVFVSAVGIGFTGFSFQKQRKNTDLNIKTVPVKDANNRIRNMPSPKLQQLKPEQPPVRQNSKSNR